MAAIHPPPKGPSAGVFWQIYHNCLGIQTFNCPSSTFDNLGLTGLTSWIDILWFSIFSFIANESNLLIYRKNRSRTFPLRIVRGVVYRETLH